MVFWPQNYNADIVTTRIAAANVVAENTGAYEGACFQYHANTFEVHNLHNGFCSCHSVDVDGIVVELPIDVVNELVNKFGS